MHRRRMNTVYSEQDISAARNQKDGSGVRICLKNRPAADEKGKSLSAAGSRTTAAGHFVLSETDV